MADPRPGRPAADGVRMALLASRLDTIARKMANTLFRTARSGLINTARDLSCCIVTARHELLAEAESLPSHVLVGPDLMSRAMVAFHPDLRPRRRVPAQLALSRQLARRRPHASWCR